MRKQNKQKWMGAGIVLMCLLLMVAVAKLKFEISPDNLFAKPSWCRAECIRSDIADKTAEVSIKEDEAGTLITMGERFTDSIDVSLKAKDPDSWTSSVKVLYKFCDGNGENCNPQWTDTTCQEGQSYCPITTITNNRAVLVKCHQKSLGVDLGNAIECTSILSWHSWGLYNFNGAEKQQLNANNCCIDGSKATVSGAVKALTSLIPSKENIPACLGMEIGVNKQWANYICGYNYVPAWDCKDVHVGSCITRYEAQDVWCEGGRLYTIESVSMKDGSSITLHKDYSDSSAPAYIKSVGSLVAEKECCPGEKLLSRICGDDFMWRDMTDNEVCRNDLECSGAGTPVPVTQTAVRKQSCIDGKCVWSDLIEVECTSSSNCPDDLVCDLSLANYGKCVQTTNAGRCGDNICQTTESANPEKPNFCPADCSIQATNSRIIFWVIIIATAVVLLAVIITMTIILWRH